MPGTVARTWRRRQLASRERELAAASRRLDLEDRARRGELAAGESLTIPGVEPGSIPWFGPSFADRPPSASRWK